MSINKQNSVQIMINTVKAGQQKGAFLLNDCVAIKKAIDYFNPEVKTKPDFGATENAELVAVNILIQACQKVNSHSNNPLSLEDGAILFEIFQFWLKATDPSAADAAPPSSLLKTVVDEESEDEDIPQPKLMTVKGKRSNALV